MTKAYDLVKQIQPHVNDVGEWDESGGTFWVSFDVADNPDGEAHAALALNRAFSAPATVDTVKTTRPEETDVVRYKVRLIE